MNTDDLLADKERNKPNPSHLERLHRDQEALARSLAWDRQQTYGLALNYFRRTYGDGWEAAMERARQ